MQIVSSASYEIFNMFVCKNVILCDWVYSHAEMWPWVWLVCVCVQVMSIMTRPTNLTLQWYQWVHMWEQTVQIMIRKCTYWFTHVKKWRSHKTNPILTCSWYISTFWLLSVTYCILQFCSWHANSRATTNSFMLARPNCFRTGCGQRGVVNGTMMNIQTAPRRPLWPANAFDYTQFTFIADLTRS